jgi:predicted PurR-regulated permease PerM
MERVERAGRDGRASEVGERRAVRIETSTVLRVLFTVLLVAAVLWTLYELQGVLLLLVLAIFFAYLIAPLVDLIERPVRVGGRLRHLGRAPAIAAVYVAVFGGIGLAANILLPLLGSQLTQFTAQAPAYINYARSQLQAWTWFINPERLPDAIREPVQNALGRTMEAGGQAVSAGVSSALGMLTFLPWLVLIPILAFFLLKDAAIFQGAALRMVPDGAPRQRGRALLRDLDGALAAYIRAQLLACLLIGAICTVGFLLIGLPYALVLGLLAGLLEFIPLAGPLVVAVVATVVGGFHAMSQAIVVLIFLGVLRVAQDYVFYPRLIGRGIHMHPLAVILAILSGAELAGVAGIFLAIPTVAVLSVIVRHWLEIRRESGAPSPAAS